MERLKFLIDGKITTFFQMDKNQNQGAYQKNIFYINTSQRAHYFTKRRRKKILSYKGLCLLKNKEENNTPLD